MTCFTQYQRYDPDSVSGHKIVVTQTYSSYNEHEIDKLEETLRNTIGCGLIAEVKGKESHEV